jgi:hypothetical protein
MKETPRAAALSFNGSLMDERRHRYRVLTAIPPILMMLAKDVVTAGCLDQRLG